MVTPKPVSLTQVDASSYEGVFDPEPLLIVGPVPGGGGGEGGDVASVNGKTGTVVLSSADIGAVPTSRTVSGKSLSANITLGIPDITGLEDSLSGLAPYTALNAVGVTALAAQDRADDAFDLADQAYGAAGLAVPQTRTVAGKPLNADITLSKIDVGLASVDNTSDVNKPISTATQAALDAKVPTTRTVAGKALSANVTLAKADVGLGNVDNTADSAKPVSTAQATAINAKVGSPNSTITGVAYYPTVASLPTTGTAGVIYYVDAV